MQRDSTIHYYSAELQRAKQIRDGNVQQSKNIILFFLILNKENVVTFCLWDS